MRLSLYDVHLISAGEEDMELIRYWRNSEKIQQRMEYRQEILPEQHRVWFNEISDYNVGSIYMIVHDHIKIGVIYSKNKTGFSEGGMFIWEDRYLNTMVPVIVSLMYTDISFYFAQSKILHIKILRDNFGSIAFNTKLGYVLCENEENKYNQEYFLTKEAYESSTGKLKQLLEKYYQSEYKILVDIEHGDFESGLIDYYKEKIKNLTVDFIVIPGKNDQ